MPTFSHVHPSSHITHHHTQKCPSSPHHVTLHTFLNIQHEILPRIPKHSKQCARLFGGTQQTNKRSSLAQYYFFISPGRLNYYAPTFFQFSFLFLFVVYFFVLVSIKRTPKCTVWQVPKNYYTLSQSADRVRPRN